MNWIQQDLEHSFISQLVLAPSQTSLILQFVIFPRQERCRSSPFNFFQEVKLTDGRRVNVKIFLILSEGLETCNIYDFTACVCVNDVCQVDKMKYV